MRQLALRFALCIIALSALRCAPNTIGVTIHVQNLPPDIISLHVIAVLEGKQAMQGAEFTQQLNQFTIKVPANAIGSGQLVINVAALDNNRCKLSTGRADTQVSRDIPYTELELGLNLLPSKLCVDFSKADFPVGTSPYALAVGDFNVDGKQDLAVANDGGGDVSVLLGNGIGSFSSAVNFVTGRGPDSVAVGDFNIDGKPDLVVVNVVDKNLSVLLGNGDGTFRAGLTPMLNLMFATNPGFVAVDDFNSDEKPDLAIVANASGSMNNVGILLGKGDGTFNYYDSPTAELNPRSLAIGDFNGDRIPDLAVANRSSNTVSVAFGRGDGRFQPAIAYNTSGMEAHFVGVGDLNRDQKLDLAVTNCGSGSGRLSIMLNDGMGRFPAATLLDTGKCPYSVVVADFNGDQKLDLVTANSGDHNMSVWLGNGDGTFGLATNFDAGTNPVFAGAGDFNGDQKPDLAFANFVGTNANRVTVLINQSL